MVERTELTNVCVAAPKSKRFKRESGQRRIQVDEIIHDCRKACTGAARKWKFDPTRASGVPVKIIGTVTFNFAM